MSTSSVESGGLLVASGRSGVGKRPERRTYRLATVATWLLALALTLWFVAATRGAEVPAATAIGRWFGLAGALLFVVLTLYGLRRVVYLGKVGTLELWYRAHLLLGVLALVLLGCHSGFAFRSAFLGALQITFWGSVLTGIAGWAYQTAVTAWMVRNEYRPAIGRELEATREALEGQLGSLAQAGAISSIREELARARGAWSLPARGQVEERVLRLLQKGEVSDPGGDVRRLLVSLDQVERMRLSHRMLRWWTTLHLLLAAAGVQLMLWHIISVAQHPR